jgi:hypothetical protein
MTRPAHPPVGDVVPLTARQLTHPAILRAQEIYNERDEDNRLRDLTEAETTFLASVHLAGARRTETVGGAVLAWGDRTEAYWCVFRMAAAQEKDDLSLALEVFESSVEADDLLEEIQRAMAAE